MRSANVPNSCTAEPALISVEVAYADVDRQLLLTVQVAPGTTVHQAVTLSGMAQAFAAVALLECPMGIFGRRIDDPAGHVLEDGDRIEIYRPLIADPMEVRRMRAAKTARPSKKRG
jgi:putative ubiquitin-RnfH superfamily antitoxin RatB of RatAB toxin-antitoxin module